LPILALRLVKRPQISRAAKGGNSSNKHLVDPPPDAELVAVKAAARDRERLLFIFCFEPSLAWRAAINWTSLNAVCCFHD